MEKIHEDKGPSVMIWKKQGAIDVYVTLEDSCLILTEKELTNNVINAYAEMLKRRYNPGMQSKFVIFDSLIWRKRTGCMPQSLDVISFRNTVTELDVLQQQSPGGKTSDRYLLDAIRVKSYILDVMKRNLKENFPEDIEECVPYFFINLTQEDYTMPLSRCINCPQQSERSLDCGVYVCHLMERFASGKPLMSSITVEELGEYKTHLVSTFIENYDDL